jgi:hypothetical protein
LGCGYSNDVGIVVPVDILVHHPAAAYAWPDDRAGGNQRFVIVAVQLFDQLPHGRRFDIKTADRIAAASAALPDHRVFLNFSDVMDVDIDHAG